MTGAVVTESMTRAQAFRLKFGCAPETSGCDEAKTDLDKFKHQGLGA
jgi:hypothetical protein